MSFTVKPKLQVCLSCCDNTFTVSDITGPWSATLNPYGWDVSGGGDSIEITDVESSSLTITSPAGTVYGPYNPNALSLTTAAFTVPAINSNVTIALSATSPYHTAWMTVGDVIYIEGAGYYRVVSFTSSSAVVTNLGITGNAVATTVIALGKDVGLPGLPNLSGYSFTIDPEDIFGTGEGEAMSDGEWIFDWVVKGTYTESAVDYPFHARCVVSKLVLCDVECCVDTLMADSDPNCGCSSTGNKKALNAHLTLEAINGAWKKNKKERAKTLLTKLQDICNNNCKNC